MPRLEQLEDLNVKTCRPSVEPAASRRRSTIRRKSAGHVPRAARSHARGFARRRRARRKTRPITRRRAFDPQMIARSGQRLLPGAAGLAGVGAVPFGLPVATPNLPDAPAPSVVTTVAPLRAGARAVRPAGHSADDHSLGRADAEHSGAERPDDAAILDASARPRRRAAARRLGGRREPVGRADRHRLQRDPAPSGRRPDAGSARLTRAAAGLGTRVYGAGAAAVPGGIGAGANRQSLFPA